MAQQQAAATQRTMLSDFLARGRDDANFARSRDASAADYERKRGDDLADQAAKTQRDQAERATRAAALQQELGIGQPTPGAAVPIPMGGANFTTTQIPPTPGRTFTNPEDVETVARVRKEERAAAQAQANKERDDARAREALLGTQRYREEMLNLRKNPPAPKYQPTPQQRQEASNAERQAAYYESLARSWQTSKEARKQLEANGMTYDMLLGQAQVWRLRASEQLAQPETEADSVPTNLSDDELDRELLGGG